MNDLEIDAFAEGIYKHLSESTSSPLEGIAVIGMTLLKLYERGTDGAIPMQTFAEDFKRSMIESWKSRTMQGTTTKQ